MPLERTRAHLPRGAADRALGSRGLRAALAQRRTRRRLSPVRYPDGLLAAACLVWLALVVAAPWAAHRGWWLAPLLYSSFDAVCHQIADRSLHLWGEPLAVCHRCTGLYLGFALGVAAWPFFPLAAARLLARPRWILAFSIPLAIDAVLLANTAASRLLTGFVAAFPIALLALAAVAQIAAREKRGAAVLPGADAEGRAWR